MIYFIGSITIVNFSFPCVIILMLAHTIKRMKTDSYFRVILLLCTYLLAFNLLFIVRIVVHSPTGSGCYVVRGVSHIGVRDVHLWVWVEVLPVLGVLVWDCLFSSCFLFPSLQG